MDNLAKQHNLSAESPLPIDLANLRVENHTAHLTRRIKNDLWRAVSKRDWNAAYAATIQILNEPTLTKAQKSALLSTPNKNGTATLLHIYCSSSAPLRLFKLHLRAGVNFNVFTESLDTKSNRRIELCTPLHLAFVNCKFDKAKLLIDHGHPLNVYNADSEDPVMMLINYSTAVASLPEPCLKLIDTFYQKGGDVTARDIDDNIALHQAIKREYWSIAEIISKHTIEFAAPKISIPIARSEVQECLFHTTVKPSSPKALVDLLLEISKKANNDGTVKLSPEKSNWLRVLHGYIPSESQNDTAGAWNNLSKVLEELKTKAHLFDESIFFAILNARRAPPQFNGPIDEFEHLAAVELGVAIDNKAEHQATFLHALLQSNAPSAIIEKVIELGANPNLTARVLSSYEKLHGLQNIGHVAASLNRHDVIKILHKNDFDFNLPDSNGRNSLLVYLIANSHNNINHKIVSTMRAGGADINKADLFGVSPATHTPIISIVEEITAALKNHDASSSKDTNQKKYTIYEDDEPVKVDLLGVVKAIVLNNVEGTRYLEISTETLIEDLLSGKINLSRMPRRWSFIGIFPEVSFANPYHLYLLQKAEREADGKNDGNEHAFTTLLPHLLFNYSLDVSAYLARISESYNDRNRSSKIAIPNHLAELMLLLNHPDTEKTSQSAFGRITSAISSKSYFIGDGSRVTGRIANIWARVGVMCYSAINFRFDAERIKGIDDQGKKVITTQSLLTKWGAIPLEADAYKRDPKFGSSYVITPRSKLSTEILSTAMFMGDDKDGDKYYWDEHILVEMRRGYFLISHPEYGTLIVRNSSKVFGRDLLEFPAYWSPKGVFSKKNGKGVLAARDLVCFSEEMLEKNGFLSINDHNIFYPALGSHRTRNIDNHSTSKIEALLGAWNSVKTSFARWKFDTIRHLAWEIAPDGTDKLVGGYNSPGFKAVVEFLEERYRDREVDLMINSTTNYVVPDLAFVSRHYPAWSPYDRLTINSDVLSVLKKLSNGSMPTQSEVDQTGIFKFFEKGFAQDAELTLLVPKDD